MFDAAPTPIVVSLEPTYEPPVVTVLLLPTEAYLRGKNYRHGYLDNVELSTPARVYMSQLTGPGPDLSEALTQTGAGPVMSFIPGDYTGAVLVGANLRYAVFDNVNMQDANFSSSNLQGAQFINTWVQGAQFAQADLRGADLSGALGLQPEQLYNAVFDTSTALPADIDGSIFGPFAG